MNYDQAVAYLLTLGRELASPQQARAVKFDLENIRALTARLGHPERAFPSVHIAGTNGKGSTAAMLAAILEAAGLRAGLYTSPHLLRINERIRLGGADISDADCAAVFTRIHAAIEELLGAGTLAAHPTYFECVTAMAFEFFARRRADLAVIEVGMGGRLDSTNVIVPRLAVITRIDFDHENFLGRSIERIAAEKAGIIKPDAWVVSAAGHPTAREVIRRRAAEQNARLVEVDAAWQVTEVEAPGGCCRFVASPRDADHSPRIEISLPLAGRFQMRNALTAMTAARLLAACGFPVDPAAMSRGLSSVRWPGRIERIAEHPAVYLDGTHNPSGARELVAFWNEHLGGRRILLVYGAMRDKAVDEIAGLLFPHAAKVMVTESRQPRALSALALANMTRHLAPALETIPDPAEAFDRALALAAPDDVVFVTGSLYLVGDARRHWDVRSAAALRPAGKI